MLPELSSEEARARIARMCAEIIPDGALINLGIGIPQLVPDYLPENVHAILQTENGIINAAPSQDKRDLRIIDAGGTPMKILPGGACLASDLSFAIMRGGHIDITILGALEVDETGNIANWMIPQVRVPGMGGAMDIVTGAKLVCAAMRHFNSDGSCKLVKSCTLPLTGYGVVNMIVTEYCVIENIYGRMVMTQIADDVSQDDILSRTGMHIDISSHLVKKKF